MQSTDWIRKKAKSFTTVQTIANVFLKAVTSSFQTPVSYNNIFFSRLFNLLQRIITPTSQNLNVERLQLIKKKNASTTKEKDIQYLIV